MANRNDWLVRLGFAVAGLLLVWLLPDPWDDFTGVAAVIAFVWMLATQMIVRRKLTRNGD